MARPPQVAPEKKIRIVMAVVAGEVSVAEASRKKGVSEASIHKWKNEFLDAGRQALTTGRAAGSSRMRSSRRRWRTSPRRSGSSRSVALQNLPDSASAIGRG